VHAHARQYSGQSCPSLGQMLSAEAAHHDSLSHSSVSLIYPFHPSLSLSPSFRRLAAQVRSEQLRRQPKPWASFGPRPPSRELATAVVPRFLCFSCPPSNVLCLCPPILPHPIAHTRRWQLAHEEEFFCRSCSLANILARGPKYLTILEVLRKRERRHKNAQAGKAWRAIGRAQDRVSHGGDRSHVMLRCGRAEAAAAAASWAWAPSPARKGRSRSSLLGAERSGAAWRLPSSVGAGL